MKVIFLTVSWNSEEKTQMAARMVVYKRNRQCLVQYLFKKKYEVIGLK